MKHLYFPVAVGFLMSAASLSAKSVEETVVINFDDMAIGTQINTQNGGPNAKITVQAAPGTGHGNAINFTSDNGDGAAWYTNARLVDVAAPEGYTLGDLKRITFDLYRTNTHGKPFIDLARQSKTEFEAKDNKELNTWFTVDVDMDTDLEGSELKEKLASIALNSKFDVSMGVFPGSDYWVDNVTLYFSREVEETWPIADFENDEYGTTYAMTGGGKAVVEDDPDGVSGKALHICADGETPAAWSTPKFHVVLPEGKTLGDYKGIVFDIKAPQSSGLYGGGIRMEVAGVAANNPGSAGADFGCVDNVWKRGGIRIMFDGSATNPNQNIEFTDEQKKLNEFDIVAGTTSGAADYYMDNLAFIVKEGGQTGIADTVIAVEPAVYEVYNLMGIRVMKTADKADIHTLPAGLYIVNGKKYLVK